MQSFKITAKSPANLPEFSDLVKSAGGTVQTSSENTLIASVPDANAFLLRIKDNPRLLRDENKTLIGTGAIVQPTAPDQRDVALAEAAKRESALTAALETAQNALDGAHKAREAAEASEANAVAQVAALTQKLADAHAPAE